jgi:hypothetical protein
MSDQDRRFPVPEILHTKYKDALEVAYTHINYAEPGTMVLIIGMSGSGKGTLASKIKSRLLDANPKVSEWNRPIIEIVAKNAENSYYSSKDTASRLLNLLKDPFHSVDRQEVLAEVGVRVVPTSHRAVPESTIRQQVHRLLIAKNVRYIIVDEADMMCVSKKSGRDEADHLESWRVLALDSHAIVIFLAGFRMLRIWDRTSQFTRKMPTVHVARYSLGSDEDIEGFVALIQQMNELHQVGESESNRILKHAAALMTATGGIFGQLKALYQRADDHANAKGRGSLSLNDIVYALPKKKQVKRLWEEIASGEEALSSVDLEDLTRMAMRTREKERAKVQGRGSANAGHNKNDNTDTRQASELRAGRGSTQSGSAATPAKEKVTKKRRTTPKRCIVRSG